MKAGLIESRTASFSTLRLHAEPAAGPRSLLVMLPGIGVTPRDFVERRFISALQERGGALDVLALGIDSVSYLEETLVPALRREIVLPARAEGYERIVLFGLSLGGWGSMLYAQHFGADIDALVLLAPFLGTPGTIAEVARAGGILAWDPVGGRASEIERGVLRWLKTLGQPNAAIPPIHLAYGLEDRFAQSSQLLAALLPDANVLALPGAHDWDTWGALWQEILARGVFDNPAIDESRESERRSRP